MIVQWPGVGSNAKPPNAGLRLYGGAAFERCLAEFQEAALELGCPAGGPTCTGSPQQSVPF